MPEKKRCAITKISEGRKMDMSEMESRYRRSRSIALRSIAEEMEKDLGIMSENDIDAMLKEFEAKKSKEI